jgi:hypothetical protein
MVLRLSDNFHRKLRGLAANESNIMNGKIGHIVQTNESRSDDNLARSQFWAGGLTQASQDYDTHIHGLGSLRWIGCYTAQSRLIRQLNYQRLSSFLAINDQKIIYLLSCVLNLYHRLDI